MRKGTGGRGPVRQVRVRKGEMATTPPDKPNKHLLPCHVRLLDGTDLYIQLPVSSIKKLLAASPQLYSRNGQ